MLFMKEFIMHIRLTITGLILAISVGGITHATETVANTYDAKGRLIKVIHTGSVNNGVTVDYTHDTADNRTNVKTVGSPN